MTDYARSNSGGATHFGDKDALSTGDADKVIVGAQFDTEFNAILTAIASKFDATDKASSAEAIAESSSAVLITPERLGNWADGNGGVVGELQELSDPGADRILFWDDGEAADANVAWLTVGNGLEIGTTTLGIADAAAGAGLTASSGVLAVGGGNGITANADDVAITDVTAGGNNLVNISSGTFTTDVTALAAVEGSALATDDTFLVDDGGTAKKMAIRDAGMIIATGLSGTNALVAAEMNTIRQYTAAGQVTINVNSTTDLPLGVPVVLQMKHATADLTVQAASGVTLVSFWHPGGEDNAADVVEAGGTGILYQTATNVWCLEGRIADS